MITQSRLKELLNYDPGTGVFTWAKNRPRCTKGAVAGTVKNHKRIRNKYRHIFLSGENYSAHRLAWLACYGEFPKGHIDHINGNGLDNRITNLRDVNAGENSKNKSLQKNNRSGVHGVLWRERYGKFVATIGEKGRSVWLGTFDTLLDACCARISAENNLGYHRNHGKRRS